MRACTKARDTSAATRVRAGLGLVLAALVLAGCSAQLGDRGGQEGAAPDRIGDVDYIEVFRNADEFPNVARICIEGLAFASTSSGGPSLVRVPEWDAVCAAVGSTAGDPTTPAPPPSSSSATAPPTAVPPSTAPPSTTTG